MRRRPPRSSRTDTHCPYTTLFRSVAEAYLALQQEDSESAARLAPADSSRIARALAVIRSTRKPLGWWHAHMEGGIGGEIALRPLLLLPPKPWLFERCASRFEHKPKRGPEEVCERLMERSPKPKSNRRRIG